MIHPGGGTQQKMHTGCAAPKGMLFSIGKLHCKGLFLPKGIVREWSLLTPGGGSGGNSGGLCKPIVPVWGARKTRLCNLVGYQNFSYVIVLGGYQIFKHFQFNYTVDDVIEKELKFVLKALKICNFLSANIFYTNQYFYSLF